VGVIASIIFGELYLGVFSAFLTFLIIMFAEIIPKIYGEKNSEKISLSISRTLIFLTLILSPINYILEKISKFFIKGDNNVQVSEGEIRVMAAMGKEGGSINSYESDVIENVFKMNDTEVYDIMIPKSKVDCIDYEASFKEIVKAADLTGHTRFPISRDDEIIGLINVKDLFKFHEKEEEFLISKILRPIAYAPEVMTVLNLEEKLKIERVHMAAIINEHGDFIGIVTLEDLIEELLGEIEDEFDKHPDVEIEEIDKNKFHVIGSADVEDINQKLGIEINLEEDYSTLNGFLTYELGKIPKVNDCVKKKNVQFRVLKANKKTALMVEIKLL
ncbi:HlyC/CorC family transporter, partial [bacterium]|nr:HlyC/CorC family transporter [bacterium]